MRRLLGLVVLLTAPAWAQVPPDDPTINLPMPKTGEESDFAPMPFAPAGAGDVVIYRHAGLIDGTGAALKKDITIVTRGQLIEVVGRGIDPAKYPGARIVDLTGKFVLPGLIDSHQHLATPPNRIRAEAQMRRDLFGGITAVREMADDTRAVNELNRAALMGEIAGPDIFTAALMAGPDFFKDPRTVASAEGVKTGTAPWQQAVSDGNDVVLAVARAKGTFATGLKFYDQLSPDLMKRLTAEGHRQGMKVWAHGFVPPAAPQAVIDAGVDVVSHTCYLAFQTDKSRPKKYSERHPVDFESFAHGDNPEMTRLFQTMAANHIILDATLDVYKNDTMEKIEQAIKQGRKPPHCTLDLAGRLTRQAIKLGVVVDAGTDEVPDYTTQYPALYDEMQLLASAAGMTPMQAIIAATAVGARTFGQENRMGTVQPGKFANLAVFAANPAKELSNLKTIYLTVKRGRVLERSAYRAVTKDELPD